MTEPTAGEAFEALLERRGDHAVVVLDDGLRVVAAGPAAAEMADRPVATLLGKSLIAAFGSASLDGVARRAMAAREAVSDEAEIGGAAVRQLAVEAIPLRTGGMVLAIHDITTLRRVERVRRDFVANISHELRTPLASIKLLAETLSSGSVDEAATWRDFAGQIEREVDHLAQLVDELLDLSRIESGETKLALEPISAENIVDDAVERVTPVATRRGIRVVRMPASAAPVDLHADRDRLGQALLNLAHNAVKYSHPGGEVRIGWEATERGVRFLVADDGIGVPRAHQPRIFERFYKVDRSRARPAPGDDLTGSAGLGLAIVRHIAEAHRGSVGLTSTEGVGSTFWIEVPAAQ